MEAVRENLGLGKEALERTTFPNIDGSSVEGSGGSYSAGRAGNAVQKSWAQLSEVKEIHAHMMESRNELGLSEANTLMNMYAKCGSMVDARHLFDNMPKRNVVSWNVIILGYAKQEEALLSLELYAWMQQECVQPSGHTFVAALKACCSLAALEEGKQVEGKSVKVGCLDRGRAIHFQALKTGCESNVFVGNTLVDMYVKCGSMDDACHVLDELPHRDVVSWNTIILGYAQKEEGALALDMYARMREEGVIPDHRSFVSVLKACSSLGALEEGTDVDGKILKLRCLEKGRAIHSQAIESGSESDVFVGTTLLDLYVECGCMDDARHAFDALPHRDAVSWTAMILGYAQKEHSVLALELYILMHQEGVVPDRQTFVGTLKACTSLAGLDKGKQLDGKLVRMGCLNKGRNIHSQVVKRGFESDVFVRNILVDMYAKCGSLDDARHVFDKFSDRNLVSWNTMISAYVEHEQSEEAFKLYTKMQEQVLSTDSITFVSILKACGNTAALETGKELHAQICRVGLETSAIVITTLIDMYAKCGSMVDAQHLFNALPRRNSVTWNALIAGYARHGESELVFHLFERMRHEGSQPDGITFVFVLTVCNHVGLANKGLKYFQAMRTQHGIVPTIEHYTCMIDLLGRVGRLKEALSMLEKMPFQPDIILWGALLGACRKWKNVEIGRHAFEQSVRLDGKVAAAYVLMSNIYASVHMWEDSEKIKLMRKNSQAWKKPGKSWWTDGGGIVHTFVVGDRRHPQSKYIYAKLKDLSCKMKEEGYLPSLDSVLWDISDDEKEDALCGHSEKLAIVCALINTPEGTPIRIVKNLRVCDDCHRAIALISKIERRNIICRDARRFHNYEDGKCSCGDYW